MKKKQVYAQSTAQHKYLHNTLKYVIPERITEVNMNN